MPDVGWGHAMTVRADGAFLPTDSAQSQRTHEALGDRTQFGTDRSWYWPIRHWPAAGIGPTDNREVMELR